VRCTRFETRAGTSSDYLVGAGARFDARVVDLLGNRPVAVVIDETVARLYPGLPEAVAGAATCLGVMAVLGGEQCKTFDQLRAIIEFLDRCRLPKHGVVVAIGGGTVSDVAGLAALLLRRSVSLVLVPTTLLAQVDAAIGGKNGINSGSTKNLVGYFCHPSLVLCDQELLATLSWRQLVCGIAESIKVFAVGDAGALHRHSITWCLGRVDDLGPWQEAVWDAVECKLGLLADDPYEASSRRLLNYGHAIAHLLEECTGFRLTHGEAVLLGMLVENEVSRGLGIADASVGGLQEMIAGLLTPACSALWVSFAEVSGELDKVREMRRGMLNLVCVARPGEAVVVDDVGDEVVGRAWRRAEELVHDSRADVIGRTTNGAGVVEPTAVPAARSPVRSISWP
jgi:3-dehydroquinate synthase